MSCLISILHKCFSGSQMPIIMKVVSQLGFRAFCKLVLICPCSHCGSQKSITHIRLFDFLNRSSCSEASVPLFGRLPSSSLECPCSTFVSCNSTHPPRSNSNAHLPRHFSLLSKVESFFSYKIIPGACVMDFNYCI